MHLGLLATGARRTVLADCGCVGKCAECSANFGRGVRKLADLAGRAHPNKGDSLRTSRLRVWFSANYDPSTGQVSRSCHKDDFTGYRLFEVTVQLPLLPRSSKVRVLDGPIPVDDPEGTITGAWFPSATETPSGDFLLAWNRTRKRKDGESIEDRNAVVVRISNSSGTTQQAEVAGKRFPHWLRGGNRIVYTTYVGDVGSVVDGSGVVHRDSEDGSYIGTNAGCVAYQQQASQVKNWRGPLSSCTQNSPKNSLQCGHSSSPVSGSRVICSRSKAGLASIKPSNIGSWIVPPLFMHLSGTDYNQLGYVGCGVYSEAYTSWGPSNQMFLVTVLCFPSQQSTESTSSRLYLVQHSPTGLVQRSDVLDLSSAIETAVGLQPGTLEFCTGDFMFT
jgi:hypothetical protein